MTDEPEPLGELLEKLVHQVFGDQADVARALLSRYAGREVERVRRAIVLLSGGQMANLAHFVKRAKQDYRDVLYWAEYPDERSPD